MLLLKQGKNFQYSAGQDWLDNDDPATSTAKGHDLPPTPGGVAPDLAGIPNHLSEVDLRQITLFQSQVEVIDQTDLPIPPRRSLPRRQRRSSGTGGIRRSVYQQARPSRQPVSTDHSADFSAAPPP